MRCVTEHHTKEMGAFKAKILWHYCGTAFWQIWIRNHRNFMYHNASMSWVSHHVQTRRRHLENKRLPGFSLPGWCCACEGWGDRSGPPVTWPGPGIHSFWPLGLRLQPEQKGSDKGNKRKRVETIKAHANRKQQTPLRHMAHLYEGVYIVHQGLGSADDELVHTGYSMGSAGNEFRFNTEPLVFALKMLGIENQKNNNDNLQIIHLKCKATHTKIENATGLWEILPQAVAIIYCW